MAEKDGSEQELEDLLASLSSGPEPTAPPKPEAPEKSASTSRSSLEDKMSEVDEMAQGLEQLLSSASIAEQVDAVKKEEAQQRADAAEDKFDLDDMESALASALSVPGEPSGATSAGAGGFDEIEEAWEDTETASMVVPGDAPIGPMAATDLSSLYQAAPASAVEEVVVVEPEKLSEKRKRFYAKTILGVAAALVISYLGFNYMIQPALRYYYFKQLVQAETEKRYPDAANLLRTCETFGVHKEQYMKLSDIALANKNLRRALDYSLEAFNLEPAYTVALNRIARVYLLQGRIDDATSQARQTLVVDPNNLDALVIQASAYYLKREIAKAQRILGDVLGRKNDYVPALELLRDIYIDVKNYNQALGLQQELTAIKKDIPEAQKLLDLGKIYYSAGKFASANAVLKDAYEKDPALWEAGYYLAKSQVGLGQFLLASEQISQTLKEAPNPTLDMFYMRALSNYHLGNTRTAIEELQRIRSINPRYAPIYVLMGKIYVYTYHEYNTGLKYLERSREVGAEDPEYYRTLGDAYFNLKQYREALNAWSPLLNTMQPTDPFLFRVSACLMHLEHMELAQSVLAKMWSAGSRSTAIYNNLGVVHELMGRKDMALRFYFLATERAVTQGRKDSSIPKRNFDRLISGRGPMEIDDSLLWQS